MRLDRILSRAVIVLAFMLGLTGSVGFQEIAIAEDSYTDSRVVDNPGGGKRTQYNKPVYVPPSRDMSGGTHGGRYTNGQAVWFPQGTAQQQPVTPPEPPTQQSVSDQGGKYGDPADSAASSNVDSGVGNTRAQVPAGLSPLEQELWRRGILHRNRNN